MSGWDVDPSRFGRDAGGFEAYIRSPAFASVIASQYPQMLRTPIVSALPPRAVAGDEVYYAGPEAGTLWHLVYNPRSTSLYKWECPGIGPALFREVVTAEAKVGVAYGDLATVGPSLLLPLAGEYDVTVGFEANPAVADFAFMSYAIGAAAAVDADAASPAAAAGTDATGLRVRRKTVAANTLLVAKYRTGLGNNVTWSLRYMTAQPVRVGL